MINEYEAPLYIDRHLSGIEHHHKRSTGSHLFENIADLVTYLRRKCKEKDWTTVGQIFYVAEKLYDQGDCLVKISIENVFVHALSSLMPAEAPLRRRLHSLIPVPLYRVYVQQVFCPAI